MRLIEFVLTSAIIEITPGPNMSYLATVALNRGVRSALAAVGGVACGLLLVGVMASFGLSEFLGQYPAVGGALRWAGVLYMVWLAMESWFEAGRGVRDDGASRYGSFRRGLTTNLLNPKLAVFYLAVMPDFVDDRGSNLLLQNLILIAVYAAVATSVHVGIVLAANHVRTLVGACASRATLGRVMASLLLGVALWLVLDAR